MIDIVIRSVIGYLSQVVPCAVLALVPFWDSLTMPKRAVVIRVAAFVAGLCAVFTAVNALPADPVPKNFVVVMELVFYATLLVFFWQYCRVVDSPLAKKVFVFLLAMAYGCACLLTHYVVGLFLIEDHYGDGRMYLWSTLPITVAVGAIAFGPALLFARRMITPYLSLDLGEREWWGQCLIPASIVACLGGGIWIPTQLSLPDEVRMGVLIVFVLAAAAVLLVLVLRAYARIQQDASERAGDTESAAPVAQSDGPQVGEAAQGLTSTGEAAQELAATSEASRELTATGEASRELVTIRTPAALISFHADEALYLEVFNHTLVVHLKGGREERANVSLSKASALLPEGRFLQCHRSYLVNLNEARSLVRYELTLSDGAKVPVSKQRYQEVRSALEVRAERRADAPTADSAKGSADAPAQGPVPAPADAPAQSPAPASADAPAS